MDTKNKSCRGTFYVIGVQGTGKSTLVLKYIEQYAKKNKTLIWWISSVGLQDKKIKNFLDKGHYVYQFFDEQDVKNGVLTEMLNYLRNEMLTTKMKEDYAKHILVFDDIIIPKNNQNELNLLLKVYRHLNLSIFSLSQDFVHQANQASRNMYNVFILLGGISNFRLNQNVFPSLRSNIDRDDFLDLYRQAVKQKYNFFLIDNRSPNTIYQSGTKIKYKVID